MGDVACGEEKLGATWFDAITILWCSPCKRAGEGGNKCVEEGLLACLKQPHGGKMAKISHILRRFERSKIQLEKEDTRQAAESTPLPCNA